MQHTYFVGIDISKLKLDVSIYSVAFHKQFSNANPGFLDMLNCLKTVLQTDNLKSVLIAFEHTGFYSLPLAQFMEENQLSYFMIAPLQIKRSLGITRGKNDKIDSYRIAEYAYWKKDKIVPTKLPSKSILELQSLLTLRDRLARQRGGFVATMSEECKSDSVVKNPALEAAFKHVINCLTEEIKGLEKAIKQIIKDDEGLSRTFKLITSIKGIALLVASHLIVYTHNFTRFDNWRKCACYAGIAPFENTSGSSLKGKTRVHHIANRQIKKMLHLAALSASHTDKELKDYYEKRVQGGKSKMSALNILRNKVLARAFAVVKRGSPYVDIMKFAA